MNIHILPAALADLDDIDTYLIESFGSRVAAESQAKLFTTFELLAKFPNIGHARADITSQPVRFFHLKPCWIVYEPASLLLIHRVYHSARDLNRLEKR